MKQTATLKPLSGSLGRSVKFILTVLFLNFIVQNTSAQTITIDGVATDWSNFCSAHVQDKFDEVNQDNIFAGNEKDFFFASDWFWKLGTAKDKNDIANGAAMLVSTVDTGVAGVGDGVKTLNGSFLVFAGDRITNDGDAQIGFWFFQNGTAPVTLDGENTFFPEKNGLPYPGDLLVLADFTGGGNDATVTVLMWTPGTGTYPNSDNNFTLVSTGAAVAENNLGSTAVPTCWDFQDKKTGSTTLYSKNEFYEGYIDLSDFISGGTTFCPSTYLLETRASQEITATLDDFIGGPLAGAPSCSITGNNTICAGSSTCFTASGGIGSFTYNWTGPNFTGSGAVVCNLTAAGTYNVTVRNASGCTTSCSRVLTVNTPVNCTITGNNTICNYQSATFSATAGGQSYVWTGPGTFTGQGTNVISNLTASGTYNLTITSAGGCTSTCNRALTVNTPINCVVTGNNTICSGGNTSFSATAGGQTYVWTGPGTFAGQGTNVISNVTAAGTYNVTITSPQGCTSTCARTLVVNNTPGCTIGGNNTICLGSSATFSATAGGTNYVWTGPGTFAGQGTNVISNLTAAGTYNLTITATGGCTSTCSRTLTVNTPINCEVTGVNTICTGASTSFTATAGGSSYAWSGPGTFTGQGTNVISNLTAAGTYNVTITSPGSCTSTCARTLTLIPNVTANAGTDPAAQCRAASIVNNSLVFGSNIFNLAGASVNPSPPATATWSVQSNTAGYTVDISPINSLTPTVTISGATVNGGTVTLRLTANSNSACPNHTDDVVLTLTARPLLRQVIGSEFCTNVTTTGSVTLVNSQTTVSYQLQNDAFQNIQAAQVGTGGNLVWNNLPAGNYTVLGTTIGSTCSERSGPGEVEENLPTETTITPVDPLCTDAGCVTLTATPAGGTFSGTGVTGNTFCTTGLAPGGYTVSYVYVTTEGCSSTSTTVIDVISCGEPLCTYTQGAFGNEGGKDCDGTDKMPTIDLINQAIGNAAGDVITIGCGTKKVTISTGEAQCVIDKLPGGGPSKELTATYTICSIPDALMKNTLLAQTITLGLNINITSPSLLSDFPLQAGTLYTAATVGDCGSDVAEERGCEYDPITGLYIPGTDNYISRSFSQALIDAIVAAGYPATVGGLFSLASDALCNKDNVLGTERGVSLSEIAGGAGSINEVFDECRISQGWDLGPCPSSNTIAPPRITVGAASEAVNGVVQKLNVMAYPNPYRNNVRFVIQSPVAGQAVLEVYNITGQKLETLYNGRIGANETRAIDYRPDISAGMMIYKLRIGDQQVTGKLIGLKQ